MFRARLRETRWRVAAIVVVLLVAAGITLVVVAPWSGSDGQRVDVVAGGGSSTASVGAATSLRLPLVTAMAVGPDGTLWAATTSGSTLDIVQVPPRGAARRTAVHTSDDNSIASMGVAPDRTLWALTGNGDGTAYRFVDGRLVPAFADFSAARRYPADGSVVRAASPQPGMTQLAFDPAGRLTFMSPAADDNCATVRRIGADGRITTLAGQDVADSNRNQPNDAPANGSDAHSLCLRLFDSFAFLGPDAVLIRTKIAVFTVDLATGRTSSLTSVSDNSAPIPPLGSGPLTRSAPIDSLDLAAANAPGTGTQLCATSGRTWFAVNQRTTRTDTDGNEATTKFPSSYDWRAEHGKLVDVRPGRGHAEVLLRVDGTRARLASAIASTVACSGRDVYVSAVTGDGKRSVIVRLPVD